MSDIAIRVENLSKQYRIGQREPYKALRDVLTDALYAPFRRLFKSKPETQNPKSETIWALKDVSFEVKHGEVVGIIGRNGAGKTTLLKVLSRITEPTEGRAEIRGRVGSLLEVGTGFHPELTGRENIYLNGAILGMRKGEIDSKFDEIVSFAEIEKFIDTPVKRYSSGMYMRLAFSVAAHLEPEIMLVDEVLAVGDNRFQRKCLGKMGEVSKRGQTILFVSHSMSAISRICQSAILLEQGKLILQDDVSKVINAYLNDYDSPSCTEWYAPSALIQNNKQVQILSVRVANPDGSITSAYEIDSEIHLEVEYECRDYLKDLHVMVQLFSEFGGILFASADNLLKEDLLMTHHPGKYCSTCIIPPNLLAEGRHFVRVALINLNAREKHEILNDVVSFWVQDRSDGTTVRGNWAGDWPGVVRPMLHWRIQSLSEESKK